MSTEEPDPVATPPSSLLPVPADALPDGQKINLTKFDDSQRQRITDIASTVGVLNSAAVTSFGIEAQRKKRQTAEQQLGVIQDKLMDGLRPNVVDSANQSVGK